ncbi:MAG: RCC1 domain-containing protein [Gemmatimonadales bacterium]
MYRPSVLLLCGLASCAESPDRLLEPSTQPSSASIKIAPTRASVLERDTFQLSVTGRSRSGQPLGREVVWSVSDTQVVRELGPGRYESRAPGRSWIRASIDDATDSIPVQVSPRVTALTIIAPSVVDADASVQLGADARDVRGAPVSVALNWSVSNRTIASVTQRGRFRALGFGDVIVTAAIHGVSAQALIGVPQPRFTAVSTGHGHTCALMADARAYCWGANGMGQLGVGSQDLSTTPRRVSVELRFQHISAGAGFTCAAGELGTWCWGDNSMMELGVPRPPRIAVTPVRVTDAPSLVAGTSDMSHGCTLLIDSTVLCWGYNRFGQVGNSSTRDEPGPVAVPLNESATFIQSAFMRTCTIAGAGEVQCWGRGDSTVFGNTSVSETCSARSCSTSPLQLQSNISFEKLAVGPTHTCGLSSGTLYCWGHGELGELGLGPTMAIASPTSVLPGTRFVAVAAGLNHSCAVTEGKAVFCWGSNVFGQLGDGSYSNTTRPTRISSGIEFIDVAAGWDHTCGVTVDGEVYCWGGNGMGQLGVGTMVGSSGPLRVSPVTF